MLGGISALQLGVILVIVIMIFGTKKLRSMGGDLGGAIKGFKKAMNEEEKPDANKETETLAHNKQQADADFTSTEKSQADNEKSKN